MRLSPERSSTLRCGSCTSRSERIRNGRNLQTLHRGRTGGNSRGDLDPPRAGPDHPPTGVPHRACKARQRSETVPPHSGGRPPHRGGQGRPDGAGLSEGKGDHEESPAGGEASPRCPESPERRDGAFGLPLRTHAGHGSGRLHLHPARPPQDLSPRQMHPAGGVLRRRRDIAETPRGAPDGTRFRGGRNGGLRGNPGQREAFLSHVSRRRHGEAREARAEKAFFHREGG